MAPLFYLTINIDMGEAMRVRKEIRAMIVPDKISFNDLVVKAAAAALRKHPNVNASWTGDTIIDPPDLGIMAVGTITELRVVKNGETVVDHQIKGTMSCDHRVVNDATAAQFLQTFQAMMENPVPDDRVDLVDGDWCSLIWDWSDGYLVQMKFVTE